MGVTSVGPLRQLWFQGKDGQHLQTEVVLRDGQVDLRRSLRRTPYLNFMAAQLRSADVKEVLVCGLGGGLLPHVLSSWGIQVLALERSGEVLDLARRFFGLAPAVTPLEIQKISVEDFEPRHSAFDACVLDIFEGHTEAVPAFTRSKDFLSSLKRALRPGGRVLQNAIDAVEGPWRLSTRPQPSRSRHGEAVRCTARVRHGAPAGPLRPVTYQRRNEDFGWAVVAKVQELQRLKSQLSSDDPRTDAAFFARQKQEAEDAQKQKQADLTHQRAELKAAEQSAPQPLIQRKIFHLFRHAGTGPTFHYEPLSCELTRRSVHICLHVWPHFVHIIDNKDFANPCDCWKPCWRCQPYHFVFGQLRRHHFVVIEAPKAKTE
eukprot:g21779.t1